MQAHTPDEDQRRLTPKQEAERKRRQRARSIAIALILGAVVIAFYVVTMIQLSENLSSSSGGP